MKTIKVKKGHILQRKGEISDKAFLVKSGLLKSYTIDDKGKEHIFMFGSENWIVSDSIPFNEPSDLFIEAIEDSELEVIIKDFGREIDQQALFKRISVLQKRVIMFMTSSALERYEHFEETYPDIIQRVPQRMIASYLGITPEALSKVKSEKARNKS